jgi:hypothetical protein
MDYSILIFSLVNNCWFLASFPFPQEGVRPIEFRALGQEVPPLAGLPAKIVRQVSFIGPGGRAVLSSRKDKPSFSFAGAKEGSFSMGPGNVGPGTSN